MGSLNWRYAYAPSDPSARLLGCCATLATTKCCSPCLSDDHLHIFFIIPSGITTCVTCCPNKSKGPPPPAPPPAPPCLGELLMRCLDLLPLARLDADSLTPQPHSLRPLQGKCHQLVRLEIEKARNLWGTRSWPRPRLHHAPLMGGSQECLARG